MKQTVESCKRVWNVCSFQMRFMMHGDEERYFNEADNEGYTAFYKQLRKKFGRIKDPMQMFHIGLIWKKDGKHVYKVLVYKLCVWGVILRKREQIVVVGNLLAGRLNILIKIDTIWNLEENLNVVNRSGKTSTGRVVK